MLIFFLTRPLFWLIHLYAILIFRHSFQIVFTFIKDKSMESLFFFQFCGH